MFYDKKIKYLDYLENGERISSAGFVKTEIRGDQCNVQVSVSVPFVSENCIREIRITDGVRETVLGCITLAGGRGNLFLKGVSAKLLGREPMPYDSVEGVCLKFGAGREARCRLRETGELKAAEQVLQAESEEALPAVPEVHLKPESPEEQALQPATASFQLQDNKWEQLLRIYPHIMPFGDEREYLAIQPRDFVILGRKSYRLANNSFLLHGFYNYEHLILVKAEQKGETRFYVGVPGNYYEKEKQVAVMFGFESFESKKEPAEAGDYGYFMIRVEI